jgi:hypothetical protein
VGVEVPPAFVTEHEEVKVVRNCNKPRQQRNSKCSYLKGNYEKKSLKTFQSNERTVN